MGRLSFEEEIEPEGEGIYFSRVTLDTPPLPRQSFHRSSSSLTSMLSIVSSRKSFSYDKLSESPAQLTVVKLDGSSFEIETMKTATISEVKQAVENTFSHLPREGPNKISWQHVWGHFCLSYGDQKLLNDSECIKDYGIKDGDQLLFVRHVSTDPLVRKRSKKRIVASNTYTMLPVLPLLRIFHAIICAVVLSRLTWNFTSFRNENKEDVQDDEEEEDSGDLEENVRFQQYKHDVQDRSSSYDHEAESCSLFRGWFQYSRISSMEIEGDSSSRRREGGFVGFIRRVFNCCGNRHPSYSSRVSQVEI